MFVEPKSFPRHPRVTVLHKENKETIQQVSLQCASGFDHKHVRFAGIPATNDY